MSEKGGARHSEQDPGALLPPSNLGYQQPHSRTLTTRNGDGDCGGRAGSPAGALPAAERKPCSSPSLSLCTPSLPTRLDSPAGGVSLCSGVPPCPLPWTHSPGIPGNGLPSTAGALPAASMPWVMPSVRLGREDEESVFLLADPLHELVDSIDGAGLGPQGTVAHVELKGIGYPRQEVLAGACEIDVLQGP